MKKLLIITFSLLLLMSASSMATGTRVTTMGDNNMILLDDANIWMFPSRINDYPRMAVGEFSNAYDSDFGQFGVHWKFKEENPCVLGTYFSDATTTYPMHSIFREFGLGTHFGHSYEFGPFDGYDPPYGELWSNRRIDLFYGRQMGGNPFGVHLSLVHSSWKEDDPADQDEEAFYVYGLSFGWTVGGNTDVAAGVEFMGWSDQNTTSWDSSAYDETAPQGNMALFAQIRHFMPTGDPDYTLIPHCAIGYSKNKAEYFWADASDSTIVLDATDEYKSLSFDAGAGLQYAASSDVMAVLDFGFRYDRTEGDFLDAQDPKPDSVTDAAVKAFTLPYFKCGLDAKVFNWMDVRFGATTYWERGNLERNDWNATNYKSSRNWADNDTYVGFGFHWGNLNVDTHADPHLFLRGLNFISGENGSDMNFRLSALYEFE